MRDLTREDVEPIYKQNYWDVVKGDQLPAGLDLCVFDFGVNAGPRRAGKYLQTLVGATADGIIGPGTLGVLNTYIGTVDTHEGVIKSYQNARQSYYENLSTFKTFGKGWTRRVNETTELALKMK